MAYSGRDIVDLLSISPAHDEIIDDDVALLQIDPVDDETTHHTPSQQQLPESGTIQPLIQQQLRTQHLQVRSLHHRYFYRDQL